MGSQHGTVFFGRSGISNGAQGMNVSFYWCGVGCGFFFFLLFAFHIFRQVMVHAWRQTLTDTELSKSHEFDVVRNLRAFDAGCQLKSDIFIGLRLVDYLLQISSNYN